MIGVIYARYSSDSQREESIDGQLRECYAFAEKQGISIIDTYIDRALSAKTDNRPAFQQMIKDSEKQKFNVVIVWKLDRFARNRYDSARYKNTLKKNNVKVVSATETISQNAEGILLESLLEGYAEYYSVELSEKVTRGMTENALKCKFNGGTVPIGYVINKEQFFEVDPVKAPYVVQAFEAYANGKTIKEIVEMLNAKGVTTSHGTKITINIVTDMLKNRRYIGEYKFQDIVNPNGIPRIVPQALFDKVQRERAKNKRATARHKAEDDYLLTTKLFCGKCGVYMTGESGTGRSGTVHRYYKCNNAKYKHTCDKKTVKKEWIEDLVVRLTREMMVDDNVIEDIASIVFRNAKKENPAIQLLKQRLSETETALNNLLRAIEEGIITSTTKQRMIELEQTIDEIKLKLIKEEMKKPTITKEGLVLWLRHIQSMSLETKEHKQRLIDIFVNAVYLYDDKLVITFNYKEASKTVTLKEVNGSIIECSGAPTPCRKARGFVFLKLTKNPFFRKIYYGKWGKVMYKRRKYNKYSILLRWLALLLAFSVVLGYIYYKMQPVIIRYAESVAETVMLNSANEAIVNILDAENIDYNDIVILTTNADGLVTSLETDIYKTNYLKSNISNEISKIIANRERYNVGIPIGTFLANTYTSGLGPDINFKMQITTTAFVDFEDKFRAAGINQVLHSINIKIKINATILVAGYKKNIKVSTTAMVAQTVIVGAVPDAFTNVIEEESDNTAGLINDYGGITGG